MGLILRSIRSLLGKGRALWLKGQGDQVLDGLSTPITTLKAEIRTVIDESWPGTAEDTLAAWHSTLGVQYDPLARTISEQQAMLVAIETAQGGSTLALLQAQFDKEFDGRVIVSEAYASSSTGRARCGKARCGAPVDLIYSEGYDVIGTIFSSTEAARVAAIIARYGPAHLTPNSLLTDPSALVVGITGLGRVGLARTGRAS